MQIDTDAIVCGVRSHGEHGAVVRMLTPKHGLVAAYVRGGRGRRMRPVLIPGNVVSAQLRSRTESQLPQATIELAHSRAPIFSEPLPAGGIEWATALVAAALPERQPYPRLYEAMAGLLDAIEAAPSASGWGVALARFELLLLSELGYGRETSTLPHWLAAGRVRDWSEVLGVLEMSGLDLFREILSGRTQSLQDSRARLVDRLRRATT
ncbi:MAG: DNA repair protein RecO [Sphingomicrobium sp.]